MPFKSQLFPGLYRIRNAHNENHAVLHNDDEPTNLRSDIVDGANAGPEWRIIVLSNAMYAIFNTKYNTWAIQPEVLTYGPTDSQIRASSHDDNLSRRAWRIEFVSAGQFIICDYKHSICWELREHALLTPLSLGAYVPGKQEQLWKFEKVRDVSTNGMAGEDALCKAPVLSLDGSGLYGIASLVVLDKMMQMLADNNGHPLPPWDVFELIGGASSGGLIAILLGRLGLDCATAWREYVNILAHLSPIQHCDLTSHDNYATVLMEVFKRYTEQRNARMEASLQSPVNSSGVKPVRTFVTTMQVRETPRISCIRSYDTPKGNPDTALNYEWMVLEAAMATCARHPYSPPLRIQDELEVNKIIPCRDPSLMGHGNPIRLAAAEADSLFVKEHGKVKPIYVSIGSGRLAAESFTNANTERSHAEQSVATMFHSIATQEAEVTHINMGTRFPARTCFRLCPQLAIDHTKIDDVHEIEKATTEWLNSREGRTQMRHVVEALLGVPFLAEPPPPPEGITNHYNPILDNGRPDRIQDCLKDYRVVFLVDDASPIESHWRDVASALGGVAQEAQGGSSFDIRFVQSDQQSNIKTPADVIRAFQTVRPFGFANLGPRLGEILQEQFNEIDVSSQQDRYAEVKPLHVVIPTTGDFPDYLQNTLAEISHQIATRKLHPNSLKIQFVLVGESQSGAAHLYDVQAFDPAHIVDVSLSFGDFNATRLKHNMLSTLQPSTVATLAPMASSIPDIFPPEPEVPDAPDTPDTPDVHTPTQPIQPPRAPTPKQFPSSKFAGIPPSITGTSYQLHLMNGMGTLTQTTTSDGMTKRSMRTVFTGR